MWVKKRRKRNERRVKKVRVDNFILIMIYLSLLNHIIYDEVIIFFFLIYTLIHL